MPKGKNDIDLLRTVPLFEGFSKSQLSKVAGLLKEDWFNNGEDIVTADDPGGRFYIITEGRAKVIVKGRAVRTIGPGGFFGEMSLIDGSPRAATVRAETDVKTVWLGRNTFLSVLEENWTLTKKVLADLVARLRAMDRKLEP